MRNKKLLNSFSIWLIALSLILGNMNLYGQKADRLNVDQIVKLIKKSTNPELGSKSNQAYTDILYETFDGEEVPEGWVIDNANAGPGEGWYVSGLAIHEDVALDCDDWLISPAIELGSAPVVLEFYEFTAYASYALFHGVFVSNSPDMSDSTLVYSTISPDFTDQYTSIDLSDWANQTIYIAFNYQGNWSDFWMVDDVRVGAPGNEIVSINIPQLIEDEEWDDYGRRISGIVAFDAAEGILPAIEVSPGATLEGNVEFNMPADGDTVITYTITSSNDIAAEWQLSLTLDDPLADAEIEAFNIEKVYTDEDGGDAVYFVDDNKILVAATADADLSAINVTELEVSMHASVNPSAVSPTTTDFSDMSVVYTVTAQDTSVKVEHTVTIYKEETVAPMISMDDSTYVNYMDSVKVKFTDDSRILGGGGMAIFHSSLDVMQLLMDNQMDQAFEDHKASGIDSPEPGTMDSIFYIPTTDLVPGVYYAYAADFFQNLSLASVDSIVITQDTVDVDMLADMEVMENVIYKYTGQALVQHTDGYRHKKWIRDDSGAIEIDDTGEYINDTVVEGDIITNLIGQVQDFYGLLQFIPDAKSADMAEIVSRDNEVAPVEISFKELMEYRYAYQSQLVRLNDVMFADGDGVTTFDTGDKHDIQEATTGYWSTFRTSYYSADYIGEIIPDTAVDVIGIVGYNWNEIVVTARDAADFIGVDEYVFNIDPEELTIELAGDDSGMEYVTITNSGSIPMKINFIYIEGDNAFRVDLLEDIEVVGYDNFTFPVYFKPKGFGNYEATLLVELVSGDIHEVALTGSYENIPTVGYPYATNFDTEASITGWVVNNMGTGYGFQWGSGLAETNSFYRVGYNNPNPPADNVMLISPPINMSSASEPVLKWNNAMWNPGFASTVLLVSVDGMNTWTQIASISTSPGGVQVPLSYDVTDYAAGESNVHFAFYLVEPDFGYGSPITWWDIDDIVLEESPSAPIFTVNTDSIGMGAVDGIGGFNIVIENIGISYFTVNNITIKSGSSSAFTLQNAPASGIDVYGNEVVTAVVFDGTLSMQEATVLVDYTDPREGNMVLEIPVSAMGVACSAPMAAIEGVNSAPYAPSWFAYTPAENALITISSCGGYADTDVKVYDACDGMLVAANDDAGCPNYASEVVFAANAGVTYMINWLNTWDASGFDFTISVEVLPTAPELLSVSASAINSQQGMAILEFDDMIQLAPAAKISQNVSSGSALYKGLNASEFIQSETSSSAKTFVPDGEDEGEPNNNNAQAKYIAVGTEDAPTKITGTMGVSTDPSDWFAVAVSEIGFYLDITLELEAGSCDMWLLYWNAAEEGWYGNPVRDITPDALGTLSLTQYENENDTVYIYVASNVAAEEPGNGYNLKVWSSAPPVFSVYRDNFKIAGPESMAFTYMDRGIELNKEYCYSVTQELLDGSESELSNSICITAQAGPGDVCSKALPLAPGLNEAPRSPSWFVYSPTETTAVTISSNIEENGDPGEDWNDTWLFVYANCDDETPLYENDDVVNGQIRTSHLEFVANAGETYLINWRRWAPEGELNAYDAEPFKFILEEGELLEGDYVENAIPVTLPLVDFEGTTVGYNHNYDAVVCDDIYMGGNDICYTFEIPFGGTISGGIEGEYVGMHVISGTIGSESCVALATGSTGGTFTDKAIMPGVYTIIISSQLPTEATDFIMDLAFTPAAKQMVTFNVDMGVQIATGMFDPATDSVDVVGTFNKWEHTMNLADADADGVYTYALPTEYFVGEKLRYKYRINADWAKAELSDDVNVYREWTVMADANATDDLFDNMELPAFQVTFKVGMARQVELQNFATDGTNELGLTGSFYPTEIKPKDADGDLVYEFTVNNVAYGDLTYVYNIDDVDETVGSRTATIVSDTVIYVWYNDDNALSTGDDLASMVDVYPNPSTGKFAIDFGTLAIEDLTIEVVNVEGKVVNVIDNVDSKVFSVDVSELGKGVYYLRINDGNTIGIEKVVIQ